MAERDDNLNPRKGTPGDQPVNPRDADERLPAKLAGDLAVLFGGDVDAPDVPERVDEAVRAAARERFAGWNADEHGDGEGETVGLSGGRAKPQAAGARSDDDALAKRWRIGRWVGSALAAAAAVALLVTLGPWMAGAPEAENNKLAVNEGDRSLRDAKDGGTKDGDANGGGTRMVRDQLAPGDVNADGKVDILDAYLLQRRIELARQLEAMWDVTGDGQVDESDVRAIAARAVSLEGGRS